MSSPEKPDALSSAHPPAVKAGGMRIVQNKTHLKEKKTDTAVPKPEEGDVLKIGSSPPKQSSLKISGAAQRGDLDFPVEAVQSFHEKPLPTHDKGATTKPVVIHQPRK